MYHFLEQLYYMYYNTRPKSAPKGVIVTCFHPSMNFNTMMGYVIIDNLLLKVSLQGMAFHELLLLSLTIKLVLKMEKFIHEVKN